MSWWLVEVKGLIVSGNEVVKQALYTSEHVADTAKASLTIQAKRPRWSL